ncbi:MAG: ferrous iron transport protein B [Candidatus Hydrogenedentota bacterium]
MTQPSSPASPAPSAESATWVALAGNPNSGKTTIFNALTGLRQKVGNYPGVTVEKKVGSLPAGSDGRTDGSGIAGDIRILDLPGTYSLSVRSPDEAIARDVLLGRIAGTPAPGMIVCVVDAGNLERNLYLASQLFDLRRPTVLVLNMMDLASTSGIEIDVPRLQEALGVLVVPTVGNKGIGLDALTKTIRRNPHAPSERQWKMSDDLEAAVAELGSWFQEFRRMDAPAAFSEAMLHIGGDEAVMMRDEEARAIVRGLVAKLDAQGSDWRSEMVEARYAWIHRVIGYAVRRTSSPQRQFSDRLDEVLTHRIWGWAAFIAVMAMMFFTIFTVASYPMDMIDSSFTVLSDGVRNALPPGDLRDLLTDGVISGVGSVVIFLPQILILFFFIGLLEDTGYMPRAAFIIDRMMSRVGLHGKSFIPLLSSFACAIPGIMATRTIESRKDRLVTMLVAPLMSCSARLPVYAVMIAALMPASGGASWMRAGIMLAMYFLGMIAAFAMAWFFKKTLLKGETPVLIMELPPYRRPSMRAILLQMWERSSLFLQRAGTVILGLSILIWALMTYPKTDGASPDMALNHSIAGRIGHVIEPVIEPLGFDWRIGIGLVTSFAAREVFVSTMGIIFNVENADETSESLLDAFRNARWPDGTQLFSPLACVSVMVFYVLAMQCLSTVAVMRRETNGWKWPLFQVAYMTILAYAGSLAVYQGGKLLGWG